MSALNVALPTACLVFGVWCWQEVVDGMSLAGCSNLNAWVRDLDKKVEAVLAKRLEKVT